MIAQVKLTSAEAVADIMRRHGISFSADFVPFSKSRNAKPEAKLADLSINWRVTLTRAGRAHSFDYMQGIGHLPPALRVPYGGRASVDLLGDIRHTIETGFASRINKATSKLPGPTAADVLECCVLDATVEDAANFEDWAAECGYDADSREAERIYRECLMQARHLRRVLGPALDELRAVEW